MRPLTFFELADYLAWEAAQAGRHELVEGEVIAVPTPSRRHGVVSGNLMALLHSLLRGKRCCVFHQTLKLQIRHEVVLYPDVFVTCDEDDLRTEEIFRAPSLVVEVLASDTEAWDRGKKFAWYRRVASLREYLLVDPDTRALELFRRGADGLFTLHDLTGMPQVDFASIGCSLSVGEIFERLEPLVQGRLPGV